MDWDDHMDMSPPSGHGVAQKAPIEGSHQKKIAFPHLKPRRLPSESHSYTWFILLLRVQGSTCVNPV